MLKRIISGAIASTFSAALLAGCGGGGGSQAVPSTPKSGNSKTGVTLKITIPGRTVATKSGKRLSHYVSRSTMGIGIDFQIDGVGPMSVSPNANPLYAQKIAVNDAAAPGCPGTAGSAGAFSCTIYIPGVAVGYNDFKVSLWDSAPSCSSGGYGSNNSCTFSGKALSTTVLTDVDVTLAGQTTSLPGFTLDPIVDSATVQLTGSIVDGTASSVTGNIVPKDADGNIIAGGEQLVDSTGADVTLSLSILNDAGASGCVDNTPNPAVPATPPCSLAFTGTSDPTYDGTGSNAFTIAYDGAQAFPTSGSSVPSVALTHTAGSPQGSLASATFSVTQTNGSVGVPGVPQVSTVDHSFNNASTNQNTLAVGSDNAIWSVRSNGMLQRSTSGTANGYGSTEGLLGLASAVASGSEGYIWYTDTNQGQAVNTTSGTSAVTSTGTTTTITPASMAGIQNGSLLAYDNGGNQEFVHATNVTGSTFDATFTKLHSAAAAIQQAGAIGRFSPQLPPLSPGSVTESTPIVGALLSGIAQGPAGNIWFGDAANHSLDMIDPNVFGSPTVHSLQDAPNVPVALVAGPTFSGNVTSVCAITNGGTDHVLCYRSDGSWTNTFVPGATPTSIVTGPDNKLYVGEAGQIEVVQDNGSGTLVSAKTYPIGGGVPIAQSLTVGHDGNIWFVETGAANATFGTLTIQSSSVSIHEYSANTGITLTAVPSQIVQGPSPFNLYFTSTSGLDAIAP